MNSQFGNKIRTLREEQNLLLRQVASILEMDTAQLSKIERGERQAKKDTVLKIAVILKVQEKELLTLWLADQIYDVVKDDENALQAMMVAEDSVKYEIRKKKWAEVLVSKRIDFSFVKSIICFNINSKMIIEDILLKNSINLYIDVKKYEDFR